VKVFPEGGGLMDLRDPQNAEENRQKILATLKDVQPAGYTNTLAALEKAYSYTGIDTIILFTDGEPHMIGMPDINERIYRLCRQHTDIPINAVGLGDYFRPKFSNFLIKIAQETRGTFLGR
jgi:hypothetical protein